MLYQIYPRSFADANGDGIGDLNGIRERLDHLSWLGVDGLWLSPFFRSPMHDFGYDVSDYCDVDPLFGTLEDFDALLAAAHERGLRVVIDWVPAHTSKEHPWFREARASRSNPKRDWYVWRDPGPSGELPNNWTATFTNGPAWTLDESTGQLYLHSFLAEQPDLNWENPEVVRAQHEVLRFWLDRGVDGFRADVVHNIGKDPMLPDAPAERARIPHSVLNDVPSTHEHLRELRRLVDGYPGERLLVGEVFLLTSEQIASYYGKGDELHLAFNFPPLFAKWSAERWRECIATAESLFAEPHAWPSWVLSNHDQPRHRTRYGSEARARAAAVLLLGLRGTPFMYMGEELGLEDAVVPPERVVDPGGRDGCRAPFPWDASAGHGWGPEPWLPWPPDAAARNLESLRADPGSILQLYRSLLGLRHASPALRLGDLELCDAPTGVLLFRRVHGADERWVAINFTEERVSVALDPALAIQLDSGGGPPGRYRGRLEPDQALLLARG